MTLTYTHPANDIYIHNTVRVKEPQVLCNAVQRNATSHHSNPFAIFISLTGFVISPTSIHLQTQTQTQTQTSYPFIHSVTYYLLPNYFALSFVLFFQMTCLVYIHHSITHSTRDCSLGFRFGETELDIRKVDSDIV